MLNDKRVAATVIAEAKHGTLKYRQHGDRLDLIGDGWALMIYQEYAKNKLRKADKLLQWRGDPEKYPETNDGGEPQQTGGGSPKEQFKNWFKNI